MVWLIYKYGKKHQMIMNGEKNEYITFIPKRYKYLVEHSSIIVIKKRVMYKLLLMVYKSQHDMVPDYITAHLLDFTPSRLLRSSEDRQLVVIKRIQITELYHFRLPQLNGGMRHLFN